MKLLDSTPELDVLASALNFTAPGVKVSSRIEAYTVKPLARDRALFKRLDAELQADLSHSPSPPSDGGAFGPLDRRENRKTLWLLIGTLNLAHPDHDFTGLTAGDFVREPSSRVVLGQLSTALGHLRQSGTGTSYVATGGGSPPKVSTSLSSLSSSAGTVASARSVTPLAPASSENVSAAAGHAGGPAHPLLRQILDPIIDLDDCEVYSYAPDFESDPHNGESDSEWDSDDGDDEDGDDEPSRSDDELETRLGNGGMLDSDVGLAWPMEGVPHATPRAPYRRRSSGLATPQPSSPFAHLGSAKRSLSMLSLSESTGGLLWSSNYFFLNRKKKRLVFISLWARAIDGGAAFGYAPHTSSSHQFGAGGPGSALGGPAMKRLRVDA